MNLKVARTFPFFGQHDGAKVMSWWEDVKGHEPLNLKLTKFPELSTAMAHPAPLYTFKENKIFERISENYGRSSFLFNSLGPASSM